MLLHHKVKIDKSSVREIIISETKSIEKFISTTKNKKISKQKKQLLETDGFLIKTVIYDKTKKKKETDRVVKKFTEVKHTLVKNMASVSSQHIAKIYKPKKYSVDDYSKVVMKMLQKRGYVGSTEIFVIADGASWIKNLTDSMFKNKRDKYHFIIDYYHLTEYIHDAVKNLFLEQDQKEIYLNKWLEYAKNNINKILQDIDDNNFIESAITQTDNEEKIINKVKELYRYIDNREEQFNYTLFEEKNMPIGSGDVESGNKMYKKRMQAPAAWTIDVANTMLNLITLSLNNEINNYWNKRKAA